MSDVGVAATHSRETVFLAYPMSCFSSALEMPLNCSNPSDLIQAGMTCGLVIFSIFCAATAAQVDTRTRAETRPAKVAPFRGQWLTRINSAGGVHAGGLIARAYPI